MQATSAGGTTSLLMPLRNLNSSPSTRSGQKATSAHSHVISHTAPSSYQCIPSDLKRPRAISQLELELGQQLDPPRAPLLLRGCHLLAAWVATVRCTYPTPEAGTCTPYVQYAGPWGKPPCASGTYPTREAGTRSPYVPNGGAGAHASAQPAAILVDALEDLLRRGALHAVLRHLDDLVRDSLSLNRTARVGVGIRL